MNTVQLIYDNDHHVTAIKEPQHKIVSIDCPYTGDDAEFSPANLLSISLGSCMLLSIGAIAKRAEIDLTGTQVDIRFKEVADPHPHVGSMRFDIQIPQDLAPVDRRRVENAAELCPIKWNIGDATDITMNFHYHVAEAA